MSDLGQSQGSGEAPRVEDARRLHAAGYTRRAVWAKWVLDDFKTLHYHLTDQGEPIQDDGKLDPSFYLDAAEWREVAEAARHVADLAAIVATCRELGSDRAEAERALTSFIARENAMGAFLRDPDA